LKRKISLSIDGTLLDAADEKRKTDIPKLTRGQYIEQALKEKMEKK